MGIKEIGITPSNYYTCQRCRNVFDSEKELKIDFGNYPLCKICSGNM